MVVMVGADEEDDDRFAPSATAASTARCASAVTSDTNATAASTIDPLIALVASLRFAPSENNFTHGAAGKSIQERRVGGGYRGGEGRGGGGTEPMRGGGAGEKERGGG
jgi:hypothetical protein